jgi:hypothetical protein
MGGQDCKHRRRQEYNGNLGGMRKLQGHGGPEQRRRRDDEIPCIVPCLGQTDQAEGERGDRREECEHAHVRMLLRETTMGGRRPRTQCASVTDRLSSMNTATLARVDDRLLETVQDKRSSDHECEQSFTEHVASRGS